LFYPDNPANRVAVINALNTRFANAQGPQLFGGAWLQLHANGSLLYNCGGINPAGGGGYGGDYVDMALCNWLTNNLPAGFALPGGPTQRWSGAVGPQGPQFYQDYYTFTRVAIPAAIIPAGFAPNIPAGNYQVVCNYHLYVGAPYANPHYVAPPPPPPPALPPPQLNLNDVTQWPPLGY
jgi:hypothetical protein